MGLEPITPSFRCSALLRKQVAQPRILEFWNSSRRTIAANFTVISYCLVHFWCYILLSVMPPPQFSFDLVLLVLVLLCATCSTTALNEEFAKKLDNGLISAKQAVKAIFDEWKVDKYPSFLKACFMHKVGWEMMKLRYQKKIIDAAQSNSKTRFVISFSGR